MNYDLTRGYGVPWRRTRITRRSDYNPLDSARQRHLRGL